MANFSELLKMLGSKVSDNIKHQDDITKDAMAHSMDKLRFMANPEMQGPPVAPDADKEYYDNLPMAVGSVAPLTAAPAAAESAAKAIADKVATSALAGEGNMLGVARSQQALSRAADFADRAAAQAANRFAKLRAGLR